jgi:hypothetical protein
MKILLTLFVLVGSASAQSWYTIIPGTGQSKTKYVYLPIGTTYRFGNMADNKYALPVTTTTAFAFSDYDSALDPDPQNPKQLDVLQGSSPIAVAVLDSSTGVITLQVVPALISISIGPASLSFTLGLSSTGALIPGTCTVAVSPVGQ